MRTAAFVLVAFLALAAPLATRSDLTESPEKAAIRHVAWLEGSWAGTMGRASIEEHWTAPLGGSMLAVARTVRDDRLQTFEYLRIVEENDTLLYIAAPEGRAPATTFTLSRIGERSATFENPAHDFPKVIRYSLVADGTLEATISGANNEKAQVFRFRRR